MIKELTEAKIKQCLTCKKCKTKPNKYIVIFGESYKIICNCDTTIRLFKNSLNRAIDEYNFHNLTDKQEVKSK